CSQMHAIPTRRSYDLSSDHHPCQKHPHTRPKQVCNKSRNIRPLTNRSHRRLHCLSMHTSCSQMQASTRSGFKAASSKDHTCQKSSEKRREEKCNKNRNIRQLTKRTNHQLHCM